MAPLAGVWLVGVLAGRQLHAGLLANWLAMGLACSVAGLFWPDGWALVRCFFGFEPGAHRSVGRLALDLDAVVPVHRPGLSTGRVGGTGSAQ